MTAMIRRATLSALIGFAAAMSTAAPTASAKAERVASYRFERVWPTALRFLRLDEGFRIVEKDAEAGYVLFELERGEATHRGSLELVKTSDYAGRDSVKLTLHIQDRPTWEEEGVLRRLLDKLRADHGQPEEPPEREREPEPEPEEQEPEEPKPGKPAETRRSAARVIAATAVALKSPDAAGHRPPL
jgi:hypothetical protein